MSKENGKLKVDIYVPLQVCSCQWESFMNQVFEVLTPYMQYIEHETKSLHSDEAAKMNLFNKCVMIEGEKIPSVYALKKELPKILKEKGLIEEAKEISQEMPQKHPTGSRSNNRCC